MQAPVDGVAELRWRLHRACRVPFPGGEVTEVEHPAGAAGMRNRAMTMRGPAEPVSNIANTRRATKALPLPDQPSRP